MPQFKPLHASAIPLALEKAEHYRLLNEPAQAESICLDILTIDPDNQRVILILLLALTDQFRGGPVRCFNQAHALVPRLQGEYDRLYYRGIILERRGHAVALQGGPGARSAAYEWIQEAMECYEKAEAVRPPNNDDTLLHWNHCVRLCEQYQLGPEPVEEYPPVLGDD